MFEEYIVHRIEVESNTIKSFYLRPQQPAQLPEYIPGQYVNIKVQLPDADKALIRSYTLSDRPGAGHVRLTIKKENEGKVSRYLHDTLKVGDVVPVSRPTGEFTLTGSENEAVVLLSGGVGITPMLSMAEHLCTVKSVRPVYFLHSSFNKAVQPMQQRLRELAGQNKNMVVSIHHTSPLAGEVMGVDYDVAGLITKNHLAELPISNARIYLCGPTTFMEAMYRYATDLGFSEDRIHYEFFGETKKLGVQPISAPGHTGYTIKFLKSGKEVPWNDSVTSILDLAEANGLRPDYSCRMGTCATCESRLIKGTFEYDPEPFMEPDDGNLLICCAIPTSNMEIDI